MDPKDADWTELITKALLQQVGRQPTKADMERLVQELRAARDDPERAGITQQLRAAGLVHLDNEQGLAFVQQVIDLTLQQLETMGAVPDGTPPDIPGVTHEVGLTMARARTLLKQFLAPNAPLAQLAKQLRPQPGDAAKVFVAAYAPMIEQAYGHLYENVDPVPRPNTGQTELLLAGATSDTIRDSGPPSTFPGGYRRIGSAILPGRTWLCWKFVAPGKRLGLAFDGLVWVDDHWAWFPKCYRVLGKVDA